MTPPLPIVCVICNDPIEIGKVKYVNEDGHPVHEPCYVEQITKKKPASPHYRQSKFDAFA